MDTDSQTQLNLILKSFTDDDKRVLIARLSRSLNGKRKPDSPSAGDATTEMVTFLDELQRIPLEKSDDTATARNHDFMLYGSGNW